LGCARDAVPLAKVDQSEVARVDDPWRARDPGLPTSPDESEMSGVSDAHSGSYASWLATTTIAEPNRPSGFPRGVTDNHREVESQVAVRVADDLRGPKDWSSHSVALNDLAKTA
jgi:hypothetical protein